VYGQYDLQQFDIPSIFVTVDFSNDLAANHFKPSEFVAIQRYQR